ncbi:MAG: hypothetical protein MZV70_70520 [Desulfobacterales bacterium]|nr:hypothetical protein [Desulfobacterales bacterium]
MKGGAKMKRTTAVILAMAFAAGAASLAPASEAAEKTVVVRGGRVVPVSGPEIENGAVLIEGGKIKAVGKADEIAVPAGAEIVEAAGGWILPGFVECLASIGLGDRYGAVEGDEVSDPVTAGLRILDALDPSDKRFAQAARAGITTLMIAPGRSNVIGARTVVLKPRGATAEEMALLEPAGIKLTLGEGPKNAFGAKGRLPGTRMGSAYVVRKALLDATEYARKRKDHQAAVAAAKGKKGAEPPPAPPRSLELEPLADLLDGKLTAFVECHRADDIQTALRLVDEFRFRAVLVGATEAYKSVAEIAKRGLPVVVGVMGVGSKRVETEGRKPGERRGHWSPRGSRRPSRPRTPWASGPRRSWPCRRPWPSRGARPGGRAPGGDPDGRRDPGSRVARRQPRAGQGRRRGRPQRRPVRLPDPRRPRLHRRQARPYSRTPEVAASRGRVLPS